MSGTSIIAKISMALRCIVTVPLVGLQCMIVVFPDQTHLQNKKTTGEFRP